MQDNEEQITFFAKTHFRNREVPFGIKTGDRRRHMYMIGKTGMGKTTLMENMAIQDIRNGKGVCFIDPHGDSVAKILDFIPANRINDVVYFNPADQSFPIAFNVMESVESQFKHLVADGLMGVFTKIWANMWSSRMEYILSNTVRALLDSPGNTILGISRMYIDKAYRKRIVDNVKDPMVKVFWTDEYANYDQKYVKDAVAPIQNKVGQFLSSGIIRNIVGQPKSTFDLRKIMDEQKILLVDISKGKIGEDNSALLGAMLVTKLQMAALSRVDIPKEEDRADFYLYVDEFQSFATDSFATILSEARKYRLNLIMGHQYIGQLAPEKSNTRLRDAIFGNVGTMICFRVGAADAQFLEAEFEPVFTPNDLVNLAQWEIILKLMINGVASRPFTAKSLPVSPDFKTGNSAKVIAVSRERYARPIELVEGRIARWMKLDTDASVDMGQEESFSLDPIAVKDVAMGETTSQEQDLNAKSNSEDEVTIPLPTIDRKTSVKPARPVQKNNSTKKATDSVKADLIQKEPLKTTNVWDVVSDLHEKTSQIENLASDVAFGLEDAFGSTQEELPPSALEEEDRQVVQGGTRGVGTEKVTELNSAEQDPLPGKALDPDKVQYF